MKLFGRLQARAQAARDTRRASIAVVAGEARRMARVITGVATIIALVVGTVGPLVYTVMTWQAMREDVALSARLYAAFVAQAAAKSSGDWRDDVAGLVDMPLHDHDGTPVPEQRQVIDAEGHLVTQSALRVDGPAYVAHFDLPGRDGTIGQVVLRRAVRPMLLNIALVFVASALLGLAIYLSLRTWPMRVLKQTFAALSDEQARSRRILEHQFDVLFQEAFEGMVVIDQTGCVRACNPEAQQLFCATAELIVGAPVEQWIAPASGAGEAMPLGRWETTLRRPDVHSPHTPVEVSVHALTETGELLYLCQLRDISDRRAAEQFMSRLAHYDSLTGLPNRSLFRDRLERAMARAQRHSTQLALMFLDLDRFKQVNDEHGHPVGDALLRHVAKTLVASLRDTDDVIRLVNGDEGNPIVARLGGDEFTVIIEEAVDTAAAAAVANRILAAFQTPFRADHGEIEFSTSIGIAMFPADSVVLDDLITCADRAMYAAKGKGRNAFEFFAPLVTPSVRP